MDKSSELRLGQICVGLANLNYEDLRTLSEKVRIELSHLQSVHSNACILAEAIFVAANKLIEDGYE